MLELLRDLTVIYFWIKCDNFRSVLFIDVENFFFKYLHIFWWNLQSLISFFPLRDLKHHTPSLAFLSADRAQRHEMLLNVSHFTSTARGSWEVCPWSPTWRMRAASCCWRRASSTGWKTSTAAGWRLVTWWQNTVRGVWKENKEREKL